MNLSVQVVNLSVQVVNLAVQVEGLAVAQVGLGSFVASDLGLSSSSDQAEAEVQVCSSAHCSFETAASDQPGSFAFDPADSEIPG